MGGEMIKETPICPECQAKMIYSQYSFSWYCSHCIEEKEVDDENKDI